jgi:hypothetical protein
MENPVVIQTLRDIIRQRKIGIERTMSLKNTMGIR